MKLILTFIDRHKSMITCSVFFAILASCLESIVVPASLSNVFNNVNDNSILKQKIIILIISWISIKIARGIADYFKSQIEPELHHFIVMELVKSVFIKYDNENEMINISILLNKIQLIKHNIQDLFWMFFSVFLPRFITIFIGCFKFYTINKKLGITIFVCLIIQILTLCYNFDDCVNVKYAELEQKDEIMDHLEDIFSNIETVQSCFNGYDNELGHLSLKTKHSKTLEYKAIWCTIKRQVGGYLCNTLIFIIILSTIFILYTSNELKKEDLTLSILTLTGLFENMYEITYMIPELTQKIGIIQNNEKFLKQLLLSQNYTEVVSIREFICDTDNTIVFDGVSFSYENHKILDNFSLTIGRNQMIGIFGASGSGKTTFIKLLFYILVPQEGQIFIADQNINEYSKQDVRKYISFQHQNSLHLFHKTVFENIVYGLHIDNHATIRSQLKNLIMMFDLYTIFKNLDENKEQWSFLDESVGKLGEKLSGGQKQLVHLFRLNFNRNARIIILDEPTSALDDVSRNKVILYLKYLQSQNKTIILISHDYYYKNICDHSLIFSANANPIFR